MPGIRPATVADVIGSLQAGIDGASGVDTSVTGVGNFVEADETLGAIDSATVTAQLNPNWNGGTWGTCVWG